MISETFSAIPVAPVSPVVLPDDASVDAAWSAAGWVTVEVPGWPVLVDSLVTAGAVRSGRSGTQRAPEGSACSGGPNFTELRIPAPWADAAAIERASKALEDRGEEFGKVLFVVPDRGHGAMAVAESRDNDVCDWWVAFGYVIAPLAKCAGQPLA